MAYQFCFSGKDGIQIGAYHWPVGEGITPKGVVQIAHGMAEHSARYARFAQVLNSAGYAVYAHDHRGHGRTAGRLEHIGYLGDRDGWSLLLNDMHRLTGLARLEYPKLPIVLFGHSMGSFLARNYVLDYPDEIQGLLLSGTGGDPGLMGKVGAFLARLEIARIGPKGKSHLLNKLTFGAYNKQFSPARTPFDWLSRDENEVDKYLADDFCGGVFTAGFYLDLLSALAVLNKREKTETIPPHIPVCFLSGEKDPVGGNGRGVREVFDRYRRMGLRDVSCKMYPGARHEILNETNRDEVYGDIIQWLNDHLGGTAFRPLPRDTEAAQKD